MLMQIHDGQCGLCKHFGEHHRAEPELIQIVKSHKAPDDLVEDCELPRNLSLHLKVTPISGCDGYEPALPA